MQTEDIKFFHIWQCETNGRISVWHLISVLQIDVCYIWMGKWQLKHHQLVSLENKNQSQVFINMGNPKPV